MQPERRNPNRQLLLGLSVGLGFILTVGLVWLFGIEFSLATRYAEFPDNWTVLEFLSNATALFVFAGATRAAYMALCSYYFGEPDEAPPVPANEDPQ